MNGLKKLIAERDEKILRAERHYNLVIMKKIVSVWHLDTKVEVDRKNRISDSFNNKRIIKNCYFNGLKRFKQHLLIENAKAARFYRYNIKLKLFAVWKIYKQNEKKKAITYEFLIIEHNLMRIKTMYFKIWREFPAEMKRSKQRQKRIEDLRSRVKEMIPDFYASPLSSKSIESGSNQLLDSKSKD